MRVTVDKKTGKLRILGKPADDDEGDASEGADGDVSVKEDAVACDKVKQNAVNDGLNLASKFTFDEQNYGDDMASDKENAETTLGKNESTLSKTVYSTTPKGSLYSGVNTDGSIREKAFEALKRKQRNNPTPKANESTVKASAL